MASDHTATVELIRQSAVEQSELILGDLAEELLRQGLWDSCERLTARQFRLVKQGATEIIRQALKSDSMNNGERAWYALEECAKARWGYWPHMTRRNSRLAYALLKKKAKESNREVKQFRKMHEIRFNEDPEAFI